MDIFLGEPKFCAELCDNSNNKLQLDMTRQEE